MNKISQLLALLKSANDDTVDAVLGDQALLAAATASPEAPVVKSLHAQEGGGAVQDLFQEGQNYRVPGREQIKVGPTFGASGASQEEMNRTYSNNAPQMGLELVAEKLGNMMGALSPWMKSVNDSLTAIKASNAALTTVLQAAIKAEEDDEEGEDEESDACDMKAKSLFAKAKALLVTAAKARQDADDCEPGDARKALRSAQKSKEQHAAKLLAKARLLARAGGKKAKETRASIGVFLKSNPSVKADMDVVQDEEEEDDDAEKAKKSDGEEMAAAKAATCETGGNQRDGKDANGNQPAAQAKAALDPAVSSEIEMLRGRVEDLMKTVQGQAAPGAAPRPNTFQFMKGDPNAVVKALIAAISEAADEDVIDGPSAQAALTLAQRAPAFMKGELSESLFTTKLGQMHESVQRIFNDLKVTAH